MILSKTQILLVLHMTGCLQNILYINLHILFIIHVETRSKIQELQESIKNIKSYQQNKLEF